MNPFSLAPLPPQSNVEVQYFFHPEGGWRRPRPNIGFRGEGGYTVACEYFVLVLVDLPLVAIFFLPPYRIHGLLFRLQRSRTSAVKSEPVITIKSFSQAAETHPSAGNSKFCTDMQKLIFLPVIKVRRFQKLTRLPVIQRSSRNVDLQKLTLLPIIQKVADFRNSHLCR